MQKSQAITPAIDWKQVDCWDRCLALAALTCFQMYSYSLNQN